MTLREELTNLSIVIRERDEAREALRALADDKALSPPTPDGCRWQIQVSEDVRTFARAALQPQGGEDNERLRKVGEDLKRDPAPPAPSASPGVALAQAIPPDEEADKLLGELFKQYTPDRSRCDTDKGPCACGAWHEFETAREVCNRLGFQPRDHGLPGARDK